jgi:hypothetical protein
MSATKQGSYRRSNGTFTKTLRARANLGTRLVARTDRVGYFLRDARPIDRLFRARRALR